MRAAPRNPAGFTLLETIVTLVIIGLIVAGLAEGTRFGLAASRATDRWVARDERADTAGRVLRALVTAAVASDDADTAGPFTGGAHQLGFTADLPAPPPGSRVTRVDVLLAVRAGRLYLRLTPRYPGAVLRPPQPVELVLADRVASLAVSYWGRRDTGTEWRTHWAEAGLPLLVRFRIVSRETLPARNGPAAPGPTVPDIVAAPFRMQMPS